jgi:E3 ubiquitin-protein ligase DOA10
MNRLLQLLTAPSRESRLEATLRRIVEAHALAMWANTSADHETYERLANDRDDAIEAAAAAIE